MTLGNLINEIGERKDRLARDFWGAGAEIER